MKMLPAVPALLAVMLMACSELQYYTGTRPVTVYTEECSVNRLMTELHDTRTLSKDQLQQTLRIWEQEFHADPSDNNRLRLALLYASGNESVRDPGRAQELLIEAADSLDNPGDRELAAMVRQLLEQQIDAYRKINDLNKQAAQQNKRITELEQQQRALMTIEQKIQQRDTPAVIDDDK
jgi:hypothetical protein